jgi:hypothetical protein
MEVASIILRSEDVDRSAEFWSVSVGLTIENEITGFAFLDGGPVAIVLSAIDSVTDDSLTEVVFSSEDVRGDYEAMAERGVSFENELKLVMSEDGRDFLGASFRDPDGHYGTLSGWVESA